MSRAARRAVRAQVRKVGKRIAKTRIRRGLSQGELGAAIGTDQGTISKIEAGRLRLSAERAVLIADALRVSVTTLLRGRVATNG